jgi:1,4-dihydroxy-2-naphthoate octaprenyltransferase
MKFIKSKKADVFMIIGMAFLCFANIWQWSVHRHPLFTESLSDFSFGLFMGVGIASLLLSVVIRSRARHRDN